MRDKHSEIDLQDVSNSVYKILRNSISYTIDFIKKYFWIFVLLTIAGLISGYFMDKYLKKYESNLMVQPNFHTVDYLYDKISLLDSELGSDNKSFLEELKITPDDKIYMIEVKPLVDIYTLVSQNDSYYNVFKTLSENADAGKVVENFTTGKNFSRHNITVYSKNKINPETLTKISEYLNNSEVHEKYRKTIQDNLRDKIVSNDTIIKQIDQLISSVQQSNRSSSNIAISTESQLSDLVEHKIKLIEENHELKVHDYNLDYIITPIGQTANHISKKGLRGKYKFIMPLVFLTMFCGFIFVRKSL
ncbi:MAG: hypothetical protein Q4G27_03235 [Flavobacteriaceae bacterium]|nr:hypothetical protein [Flavobacteriaceae bacterium]